MKYFLYLRKSTEEKDRQILSIESQKDELKKRFPELEIVKVFEESKSAFKPYNRPVFAEMLKRIQDGEADGIAAWDPSRLSRNPLDGAQIIHFLDTGVLKDLKFASYHFDNSPEGKMMLAFALSQSKYSSDKLSKDVMRGMLKKCEKGHRPGMAPVGYMNDYYALKGEKKILIDTERFDLVRKMWDMLLSGCYSVRDIWKIACNDWHFTTSRSKKTGDGELCLTTMYKIFTNKFYYGEFDWAGQEYKSQQLAMITREEFDRAQIILGRKGKPRPQKYRFPFTGIIKCGTCGCMVTAEHKLKKIKKTGQTKAYTYYHCTHKSNEIKCNEKSVDAETLEEKIKEILESITIPENLLKCSIKHLSEINDAESKDRTVVQSSVQKAYNDCVKKIDNLLKLYISADNVDKSLLSEEEFRTEKLILIKEKENFSAQLGDCDQRVDNWLELTEKTFNFVTYAKYHFETGSIEDKKLVFQTLGQNFLLKDQKLGVELQSSFLKIQKGMETIRERKGWLSLILKGDLTCETPKSRQILEFWSG